MSVEKVQYNGTNSAGRNVHKVHTNKWRRWTPAARCVFNTLYSTMKDNQWVFLHPKQEALTAQKWRTVAWNAAWIAADEASEHNHG